MRLCECVSVCCKLFQTSSVHYLLQVCFLLFVMRVGRRGGLVTVSALELLTSVLSGLTGDILSVVLPLTPRSINGYRRIVGET